MSMRDAFSIIFFLLAIALGVCAVLAQRSNKVIGSSVAVLLCGLIPPVIGNLIIISSTEKTMANIGCYIYFIGMDIAMYALLRFTFSYCRLKWPNRLLQLAVYTFLIVDAVQLLLNPVFGQAFTTEVVLVDGNFYYKLVPYLGQAFHRIVDYGIFLSVLLIFLVKTIHVPRIYAERYSAILIAAVAIGLWETMYVFSGTPVDRSMVGFGVFGLMVFYFSLYYRPVRLLDRMLARIASELPDAVFFFDAGGRCIWANKPGIDLANVQNEDFEPAKDTLFDMFGTWDIKDTDWEKKLVMGEDVDARYYTLEGHGVTDRKQRFVGSFVTIQDRTEEQRTLRKEKYNATHDLLTGLYTQGYLYERIQETLKANPEVRYDVIFVNVNEFKVVNDIFGNAFGDHALKCIANWIRENVSKRCLYGRLAGDTFGILMPADEFDRTVIEQVLANFVVEDGNVKHHILMHLGVYEVVETDLDVSVMFDRARLALSTIKDEYQNYIAFYDEEMRNQVLWSQHITQQLPNAIAERQIRPYLQPIVDQSGKVVGAEALVRWIHPVDGFLSPAEFVPVFEKNGMIAEVDKYMWRSACEILAGWKKEGRDDLFISVNISPKDFYFMDVAAEIKNVVSEFQINPRNLRVEITETVMMTDIENRVRILNELKQDGFLVEMDDFGSGYSSLNLLKDMPVDVIKIDMKFLSKSHNDEKAQTILSNVVSMSGDLGISSLTEGVETHSQYQMLTDMGCKLFQGYYFAKPMPLNTFEETFFQAA